VNVYLLADGK